MNSKLKTSFALLFFTVLLYAQNDVNKILSEIETNNSTLFALRKKMEAQQVENKTGIFMQNPEIEFNYLWGSPTVIGNRTDFSIRQSFDFPTAYTVKKQIATFKNEQAELEYRKQKKELRLQAHRVCIELIYYDALKSEYSKQLNYAQNIALSYQLKFEAGEINILDYNKSQLNLLNLNTKMDLLEIERSTLMSELIRLNGNKKIEIGDLQFQPLLIPADFEKWYTHAEQTNPVLSWLKQELEIGKKQMSLTKALSLPKMHAGYMSEFVGGEQFRGISVGLSIPLWENKNKISHAKANLTAIEAEVTDNKVTFYKHLKALHYKSMQLQKNLAQYQSKMQLLNNTDLLKKALDKGEISLIDYMQEHAIYYENIYRKLEIEKELHKTVAELNQYL